MRSWIKYILLLLGTIVALYIGASLNYFEFIFPSSELVYSEIEYCTFVLAAVMVVCTGIIVSHLKKGESSHSEESDDE